MGSADWGVLLKPTVRRILDAMLAGAKTLTELSDATGISKSALLPHLKALAALGAIEGTRLSTSTGTEAHYRLLDLSLHLSLRASGPVAISWAEPGAWSSEFPLVNQVRQPEVRAEIAGFLRALRGSLGAQTDALVVILFGSAARGEATWKSDIDILILVADRDKAIEAKIAKATFEAQMASQHAFSTTFVTRAEWPDGRKRLVQEAKEEGIIVWAPRGEEAPWSTLKRYRAINL